MNFGMSLICVEIPLKKNLKMTCDPEILLQAENQYPNEENKTKIRAKYAKLKKLFNFTFSASTKNGPGLGCESIGIEYSLP